MDHGAAIGGVGASLSDMYQSGRRIVLRIRGVVERLESSGANSALAAAGDLPELVQAANRDVAQIQSLCVDMDRFWRSVGSKGQRDLWRRKVEQLGEEVESLKASLDKHLNRQQKLILEAKERAELFQRASGESSHILRVFDEEAQAMVSARNSSQMLDEAYSTGVAILSTYAEQRDILKRAQRKALDMLNTVGLSNSVLKVIERRHRVDKWIACAGMAAVVVVVYLFWRWTH